MRTQLFPTLVGAFVLVGLLIMAGFVLYRVQAAELQGSDTYVLYFDGSMGGLDVGSPLTYRGIKVGEVTSIGLVVNTKSAKLEIPVYIQLLKFNLEPGKPKINDYLLKAIQEGLRAQLYSTSILTGTVGIRLVQRPDVPLTLRPAGETKFVQIPTIPGSEGDLDVQKTLSVAEETFESLKKLVVTSEPKINTLLDDAAGASVDAKYFFNNFSNRVEPSAAQFNSTLIEISKAAGAVKQLSNQLERNPESLITGKR